MDVCNDDHPQGAPSQMVIKFGDAQDKADNTSAVPLGLKKVPGLPNQSNNDVDHSVTSLTKTLLCLGEKHITMSYAVFKPKP